MLCIFEEVRLGEHGESLDDYFHLVLVDLLVSVREVEAQYELQNSRRVVLVSVNEKRQRYEKFREGYFFIVVPVERLEDHFGVAFSDRAVRFEFIVITNKIIFVYVAGRMLFLKTNIILSFENKTITKLSLNVDFDYLPEIYCASRKFHST